MQPSISHEPTLNPSQYPSENPTLTKRPSFSPSLSILPSEVPSLAPTLTKRPSIAPSLSSVPTLSSMPTGRPTYREEFGSEFLNADVGLVSSEGNYAVLDVGLYSVQGSGADIWSTSDNFHYMYVESSGDATFTALIENFEGNPLDPWAKVGIMFREDLSPIAAHYSMFTTGSNGIANNYRSSKGGETVHIQTSLFKPDPRVWFRIAKSADVFTTYYKPAETSYWYQFGARLSLPRIDQNGVYYVGIAISSHSTTDFATAEIGSIQLTRTCTFTTDRMQCEQASNCDLGYVTGTCYDEGTRPDWELTELTNNVMDYGSHTEAIGCMKTWRFFDEEDGNLLTDGLTNVFKCNLDAEETGMIFQPSHGRFSLAKAIRFYANKDCVECDPVSYVLEGRRNTIDYPLVEPQFVNSTEPEAEAPPIMINNVTLEPADGTAIQVSDFDGKFMIVGAPVHEAAYIYELIDGNETWVEVALLLPEGGELGVYRGDAFGCSVAISGTTAIVGTCAVDPFFGYIGQGEAYVFVQDESVANGTVWTQQAKVENAPSPNCYQKSVQSGTDQYLYEICIGESGVSSQTLVSSTPSVVTSLGTYAGAEGWNTGLVSLFWTDGDDVGCSGLNRGVSPTSSNNERLCIIDTIPFPRQVLK